MTPMPLTVQLCEACWVLMTIDAVHGSCCRLLLDPQQT